MTTSDGDMMWRRCAHLGRVLLPLVDQEPWRQVRRHENLRTWGIDVTVGERLIEIFAALAARAAAADASLSAVELGSLPVSAVADAATGKRDIELLTGLPDVFSDSRDAQAARLFRLCTYRGGQTSRWLFQLSTELHHVLVTLASRSPIPFPTCGDIFRRAAETGPQQ